MTGSLFKNHKIALAFVGVTVFGVLLAIGTEDNPGTLYETVTLIEKNNDERDSERSDRDQREEGFDEADEAPDLDDAPAVIFASDEELINSAEGFDPRPKNNFARQADNRSEEEQAEEFAEDSSRRAGGGVNPLGFDDE